MKGGTPKFAFEAQSWDLAIERTFLLKKVFRQTDQRASPAKQPRSNAHITYRRRIC